MKAPTTDHPKRPVARAGRCAVLGTADSGLQSVPGASFRRQLSGAISRLLLTERSMHALSLPTWWIHIASVIEWMLAIVAVERYGRRLGQSGWRLLALAMLPALISAMAACLWHLFDNTPQLQWLVVLQAGTTLLGNGAMAWAAWRLLPVSGR